MLVLQKLSSTSANPWATWAPVASVVIAAFSLFAAIANRKTAKKALKLSQIQEERRTARLDVSLMEAVSWRPSNEAWRLIGMRILAVNPTDRDGSLVSAELNVAYTAGGSRLMVLKIPHAAAVRGMPKHITPLEMPIGLPSNGAIKGWLVFKINDELVSGAAIEGYDATIRDSRGPTEHIQAWILREIADAEEA